VSGHNDLCGSANDDVQLIDHQFLHAVGVAALLGKVAVVDRSGDNALLESLPVDGHAHVGVGALKAQTRPGVERILHGSVALFKEREDIRCVAQELARNIGDSLLRLVLGPSVTAQGFLGQLVGQGVHALLPAAGVDHDLPSDLEQAAAVLMPWNGVGIPIDLQPELGIEQAGVKLAVVVFDNRGSIHEELGTAL
jgi:hypothetical protein